MTLKTPKEQAASDLAAYYDTGLPWIRTVSYTPRGGEATTITARLDRDGSHQEPWVRGDDQAVCEIAVRKSEVANPQYGDAFVFDGDTWGLHADKGVNYEDEREYVLVLERAFS